MIAEKANGIYTDFRIPGIVATEEGVLLRYCECRKSQGDWAEIDIQAERSEDGGKSWEKVLLIKGHGNTLNNPVMFACRDRLILLYCKNYKELWKCVSMDGGKSFSVAKRVFFESNIDFFYNAVAVGPGHGITHKDRLIVPIWFACNREKEKSHHPSFISTLYSADAGKSWQLGDVIFPNDLKNPSECALAVTKEDEVLISIRHEGASRTRALAKSADGTSGWYGLRFEEALPDPICMGSMTQKSGRIYHINCDSTQGRTNLTLTVSDDAFQTCKKIPISKEGGYADIALLGNKLFVFYEKTLDSDAEDRKWKPFLLYFDEIAL